IPVGATAVGPVAANAWTGFNSPAGTIYTDSGNGATGNFQKYLRHASSANSLIATSINPHRDQEVTAWGQDFVVFLRLVMGKALSMRFNVNANYLAVFVSTGVADGVGYPADAAHYALFETTGLAATAAGGTLNYTTPQGAFSTTV